MDEVSPDRSGNWGHNWGQAFIVVLLPDRSADRVTAYDGRGGASREPRLPYTKANHHEEEAVSGDVVSPLGRRRHESE